MRAFFFVFSLMLAMTSAAMEGQGQCWVSAAQKFGDALDLVKKNNVEGLKTILEGLKESRLTDSVLNNQFSKTRGCTLLQEALSNDKINLNIISLLLKNGADPNIRVSKNHFVEKPVVNVKHCRQPIFDGWTASHIAVVREECPLEVIELLKEYGCNFKQKDNDSDGGWSAEDLVEYRKDQCEEKTNFWRERLDGLSSCQVDDENSDDLVGAAMLKICLFPILLCLIRYFIYA
jgi:hypothetical protein